MLDIVILRHFFHLKYMLPNNSDKICVRILTLFLAFPISVLLTSSHFTSGGISSDFIWEERKLKKLWIQVESLTSFFGLPFWAAFTLSILLPIIPFWSSRTLANFTFFSMSSKVVEWWCAYSTLPFDGSRYDGVWQIFLGCIYGLSLDMYFHKIYFFLILIFFPKNWQQIWYNLSTSLVWNPSAIVYNTH